MMIIIVISSTACQWCAGGVRHSLAVSWLVSRGGVPGWCSVVSCVNPCWNLADTLCESLRNILWNLGEALVKPWRNLGQSLGETLVKPSWSRVETSVKTLSSETVVKRLWNLQWNPGETFSEAMVKPLWNLGETVVIPWWILSRNIGETLVKPFCEASLRNLSKTIVRRRSWKPTDCGVLVRVFAEQKKPWTFLKRMFFISVEVLQCFIVYWKRKRSIGLKQKIFFLGWEKPLPPLKSAMSAKLSPLKTV